MQSRLTYSKDIIPNSIALVACNSQQLGLALMKNEPIDQHVGLPPESLNTLYKQDARTTTA